MKVSRHFHVPAAMILGKEHKKCSVCLFKI